MSIRSPFHRFMGAITPVSAAIVLLAPSSHAAEPADAPAEVVVHGQRGAQPAGKLSVSAEAMSHVPGTLGDPLKALQSLPGVASTNDASSAPAIRGSRPEDNRFIIDGLPAGNVFHVGGLTSVLHPDLVDRFDLYSAAFGAPYGDATGAAIDVKLRRPRTDRIGGSLTVGLLGADALVEGPVAPNQSFYFAGKRSWIDLVAKQASDGKDANSDGSIVQMPRYGDYMGKYLWRLSEAHELQLHASGATDRLSLEVPAGSKLGQQQPVLAGSGSFNTSDHTEALTLESQPGSRLTNRLSVGQHALRSNNRIGSALDLALVRRDRFVLEQAQLQWSDNHTLSLGAELHDERSTYHVSARNALCTEFAPDCDYGSAPDVAAAGVLDWRSSVLYAQDRWRLAPQWVATVGVHRAHETYLHRTNTEPRLGLEWQATPDTSLSLGWGRYNQMPEAEQMAPDLGNPHLDHLHATHAVLGVQQKLSAAWSWQAEVYRKTMTGLVIADPLKNYANGGSGSAHGIELMVKKNAVSGDRLSGWVSVSYAQSRRHNDVTGESFRFAYDQPLIVQAVGSYQLRPGWLVSAKWAFHSGQPDTAIVGTGTYADGRIRPLYGPLNGDRLSPYHRLDLRVERQISPSLQVYGELINAYGRKNLGGWGYAADYKSRYPEYQLGLLPSAGLRMTF
jgi:outer membrane receptor protein involved in Fe transport